VIIRVEFRFARNGSVVHNCTVRAVFYCILLFVFTTASDARTIHIRRTYDWGTVRLSAGSLEKVQVDNVSWCIFSTDVIAKIQMQDGRCFLLATGRLEFDPATGDFTATEWPFIYFTKGENSLHFEAVDHVCSFAAHDGTTKLTTVGKDYIGTQPEIMQRRRRQLSKLMKNR